jgi:hypothetical protein
MTLAAKKRGGVRPRKKGGVRPTITRPKTPPKGPSGVPPVKQKEKAVPN